LIVFSVEVRNYQSIEHATLTVDGFTTLVGRSNIGKSAFVRAVRAALTNAPGSSAVRHGPACPRRTKGAKSCKCFASVHLRRQGFDLLWEKGDAVSRYTLNGQVYDRPGTGAPEFLQAHGFAPAKVGDEAVCLQVVDQFRPIFLLDESGPSVAEALADVARLDAINAAVKLADRDRREAVSSRKVRERDLVDAKARLEGFVGLGDALAGVKGVERALATIRKTEVHLASTGRLLDRLVVVQGHVEALAPSERVLLPSQPSFAEGIARVHWLDNRLARLRTVAEAARSLRDAEKASERVPEAPQLEAPLRSVQALDGYVRRVLMLRSSFAELERADGTDLPLAPTFEALHRRVADPRRAEWVSRLDVLSADVARLEGWDRSPDLAPFDPGSAPRTVATLTAYANRLAALELAVVDLERQHADAEANEAGLQAEVDASGLCPTCSQPLPCRKLLSFFAPTFTWPTRAQLRGRGTIPPRSGIISSKWVE
jgi:hypothetical protein